MIVKQVKLVNPLTLADTDRTKSAATLVPCPSTKLCRFQVRLMYDAAADGFQLVTVMFSVKAVLPVFLT